MVLDVAHGRFWSVDTLPNVSQMQHYLFCLFQQIAALEEQLKDEKSKALQDKEFLVSIHKPECCQGFHPK